MNNDTIEAKISEIQLGNRHRKDMGDIEALAQSIQEEGLLQPIGITPDNVSSSASGGCGRTGTCLA